MTTVEQIRAEIDAFKSNVVSAADAFADQGQVTRAQVEEFLTTVGIERPESPEVRQAREELAALKATVRTAVEAVVVDDYSRRVALSAMGL